MKVAPIFFMLLLALTSCAPESNTDYVQLSIPPELQNQPEAVKALEKDAEILNDILNCLEDALIAMTDVGDIIAELEEDSDVEETKELVVKKISKMEKAYANLMFNAMWFATHEFVSENNNAELFKKLSSGETIAIEKTVSHLKVSKEIGERKIKEFGDKFEDLSKRIEAKKEVYDKLFKKD